MASFVIKGTETKGSKGLRIKNSECFPNEHCSLCSMIY